MLEILAHLVGLLATATFVAVVWVRRREPTAKPLLGVAFVTFAGAVAVASVVHLEAAWALADAMTGLGDDSWLVLAYVYTVLALGLWVPFGLQYTGRGDRVAAGIIILVAVLVVAMIAPLVAGTLPGVASQITLANMVAFVALFTIGALATVSLFVVIEESLTLGRRQLAAALLLGIGVVALGSAPVVATVTGLPGGFAVLLGTAGIAISGAVVATDLFETLPVVREVGRDRVIHDLANAVLVVDRRGTIRDLNPAAVRAFDVDRANALGLPAAALLPGDRSIDAFLGTEESTPIQTTTGRDLSVTATRLTDNRDRPVGAILVCRDVTARRDRERRLGLLNQLLVGALREEMDAVMDGAQAMQSTAQERTDSQPGETAPQEQADQAAIAADIWTRADELITLVARAREIEQALQTATARAHDSSQNTAKRPSDGQENSHAQSATELPPVIEAVAECHSTDPSVPTPAHHTPPTAVSRPLLEAILATVLDRCTDATTVHVAARAEPAIVVTAHDCDITTSASADPHRETGLEMGRLALAHVGGELSTSVTTTTSELRLSLPPAGQDPRALEEGGAEQ